MTPGARVSAAIEILNSMADGVPAEQALTRWARASRYAGSKDRAAVRDHVFDVLRQRRSAAHFGGGEDGRALMIGQLRQQGADLDAHFNGEGHAPLPLTDAERTAPAAPTEQAVVWNLPDWILPAFETSLSDRAEAVAKALQSRAPITLRVNLAKAEPASVAARLAAEDVMTRPNPVAKSALTVIRGERKIRNTSLYQQGEIELQDASSQAVVALMPKGARVLDYCAGGGGKALAIAMNPAVEVFAHDIDPRRMADLPERAARAGSVIHQLDAEAVGEKAPFDVVLCDAPCSGSGAWRRAAEGKWTLTAARLSELTEIQDTILDRAAGLVAENGHLVYATCSVLQAENEDRIKAFLARHAGWSCLFQHRFNVDDDGDGFYTAHLKR